MKLKLNFKRNTDCTIFIGKNLDSEIIKTIITLDPTKIFIITDNNLKKKYGVGLQKKLKKFDTHLLSYLPGEINKNLKNFKELQKKLLTKKADRKSLIISLGGGVTGDLSGFVASTYMRGIPYIQIPTSLLGMVDSSVGGKTGINLFGTKNIIGAIYQPKKIFIDVNYLKTLPEKEIKNGLVEIIKTSIMGDKKLFDYILKNKKNIKKRNLETYKEIISKTVKIKSKIVVNDELDQNVRKMLNYGHTIGHAIETIQNYKKYSHGQAIELGLKYEAKIANLAGILPEKDYFSILAILNEFCFGIKKPNISFEKLLSLMELDKKNSSSRISFAVPKNIGKIANINGKTSLEISKNLIKKAWEAR